MIVWHDVAPLRLRVHTCKSGLKTKFWPVNFVPEMACRIDVDRIKPQVQPSPGMKPLGGGRDCVDRRGFRVKVLHLGIALLEAEILFRASGFGLRV